MFRSVNDDILERGGGFMYVKKENKFLVSKKTLQTREVRNNFLLYFASTIFGSRGEKE